MFKRTLAVSAASLLALSLGAGTAAAQNGDGQIPAEDSGSVAGSLASGPLSDLLTEEHENKATDPSLANCTKSRYHDITTAPWKVAISECEENAEGEWSYTYRELKEEFKFLEGLLTEA